MTKLDKQQWYDILICIVAATILMVCLYLGLKAADQSKEDHSYTEMKVTCIIVPPHMKATEHTNAKYYYEVVIESVFCDTTFVTTYPVKK